MNRIFAIGLWATIPAAIVSTFTSGARADDPAPPKADVTALTKLEGAPKLLGAEEAAKRVQGLEYRVGTGATLSISDNRSVASQLDGTSYAFGFKFDGLAAYNHGAHEWRNSLQIAANMSQTPALPRLIKGADSLGADTIYLYHIVEAFGLFGRAKLQTSMFRGVDVRAVPIDYIITHTDGTVQTINGSVLPLSDPFKPMTLTESAGVFVQPYRRPEFNLEVRLGPGAQEILAHKQLSVTDDATTLTSVEVTELDDSAQLGPEADLAIWGDLKGKKLTYRIEAGTMMPLLHSSLKAGDDRNAVQLTNFNFLLQISAHLVDWASLDYDFRMVRQPQLLDDTQFQNNLLLTLGITVASAPPKKPTVPAPPPPPPVPQ